jgi:galactokinase
VPFPENYTVAVCDTRASRQLTGSEYGDRRGACEDAAEFFQEQLPGVESLRDISLSQFIQYAEGPEGEEGLSPEMIQRGRFIIEENRRVLELAEAFKSGDRDKIGLLFSQSFIGAQRLFEIVVPEMEDMQRAMTASPGVIGSRQAGAGFGGCLVAVIEKGRADDFSRSVRKLYTEATGIEPAVYIVSPSAGAGTV